MMNKKILKKDILVEISDVDYRNYLHVETLLNWFQNLATEHATELGFGYRDLEKMGCFWALVRMQIDFKAHPKWGDSITIKTWSKGTNGFFAMRDFEVADTYGNILIKASSAWLMIDRMSRKPTRKFGEKFASFTHKENALENVPPSISIHSPEKVYTTHVLYSDLDQNKHMNNTKYIHKILNAYDMEHFDNFEIKSMIINYKKELLWKDTIDIFRQKMPEKDVLMLKHHEEVLLAEIYWQSLV